MGYVDGFLIPIPKKQVENYKKMAKAAGKYWMKYGAIAYVETILEDGKQHEMGMPFDKLSNIEKGETIAFSYIVYKNRKHRDAVNKKVMADEKLMKECQKYGNVFDCKRMAYSGFKTIVEM